MDMGPCNDSYSAAVLATELAKALDCTVNDLPLSLALTHLEQKAAAFLLTMPSTNAKDDLVILAELCERITMKKDGAGNWEAFDPVLSFLSYMLKARLVPSGAPVINVLLTQH
jgi:hydroxylamine reductase (hybrid-cluster protein)